MILVESSEPTVVFADPTQLEQVIVNLVINARDAMATGGVLGVEISRANVETSSLTGDSEAGWYATLKVSDTGHGIPESVRDQIFEPFFTTKETGKGTGLGLATVYGIVKQSGGFIRVESQPGHGARFIIYLPISDRVPIAPDVVDPPFHRTVATKRGGETILVVEDEDSVRGLVVAVLRRSGYSVIESADGHDALAKLRNLSGDVHLVVTDVVMPNMHGPDLAAQLQESSRPIPVLFISGYAKPTDSLGDAPYLQKPFTPRVLVKKVQELLGFAHES